MCLLFQNSVWVREPRTRALVRVSMNPRWHVCLWAYIQSVYVVWTQCSANRPWTQASSDRQGGGGGGGGVEGLTLYSLESLCTVHTPLTPPPFLPSCPSPHNPPLLPPPTPCCLAPSARRRWRCTHALPHCVRLCLFVSKDVCAWVCVFVCVRVSM